jgi:short-subunit dehydrogenase involved in D-alanine esterification of teichoic acids
MARFSGKRILITAGTSGIGLSGASRIAEEGGKVAVTGLSPNHLEEASRTLLQVKLSRNSNQIARGRIRRFESYMQSQPVQSLRRGFQVWENRRPSRGLG